MADAPDRRKLAAWGLGGEANASAQRSADNQPQTLDDFEQRFMTRNDGVHAENSRPSTAIVPDGRKQY